MSKFKKLSLVSFIVIILTSLVLPSLVLSLSVSPSNIAIKPGESAELVVTGGTPPYTYRSSNWIYRISGNVVSFQPSFCFVADNDKDSGLPFSCFTAIGSPFWAWEGGYLGSGCSLSSFRLANFRSADPGDYSAPLSYSSSHSPEANPNGPYGSGFHATVPNAGTKTFWFQWVQYRTCAWRENPNEEIWSWTQPNSVGGYNPYGTITVTDANGERTDVPLIDPVDGHDQYYGPCASGDCPKTPGDRGNPVNVTTGNMYYTAPSDLMMKARGPELDLRRTYNSQDQNTGAFGLGWSNPYGMRMELLSASSLKIFDRNGRAHYFAGNQPGIYEGLDNEQGTVTGNSVDGYEWIVGTTHYSFSPAGQLAGLSTPSGDTLSVVYDSGTGGISQITMPNGSGMAFSVQSASDVGGVTRYFITAASQLDGMGGSQVVRRYEYFQDYGAIWRLRYVKDDTGVILEEYVYGSRSEGQSTQNIIEVRRYSDGVNYTVMESHLYDKRDRVITTTGIGGDNQVSFIYSDSLTIATDSLGGQVHYSYEAPWKVTSISGDTCSECGGDSYGTYTYDDYWNITSVIDRKGVNETTYARDSRGNILVRTEALGLPEERSTTYEYHPVYDLVTKETTASILGPGDRVITYDYHNAQGNTTPYLYAVIEDGYTHDASGAVVPYSHETQYSYNAYGQVTTIDGPRMDVADVTSFIYDEFTGDLLSVTDPVGSTTSFSGYDLRGNPGNIIDSNGVATDFSYDSEGRISQVTRAATGEVTTYAYYFPAGSDLLSTVTLPGGNVLTFGYDAALNLASITDGLGNTIAYSYDTEGNRTEENVQDPGGTLVRTVSYIYDTLNRLDQVVDFDGSFTQYGYDDNGNRDLAISPDGRQADYTFDALNRLSTAVREMGAVDETTGYGYDPTDNLTSVTDAGGNTTSYTYDDAGRLLRTDSPDTGVTKYAYDEAGNLIYKEDARGVVTQYSYDAANRLTQVSYPSDPSLVVTYEYDLPSTPNGLGRLCRMTDATGTTTYNYDAAGRVTSEVHTISGTPYTVQYTYNTDGSLDTMTYPSGRSVSFARDVTGAITSASAVQNGLTSDLITATAPHPFGGYDAFTYGNGVTNSYTYDLAGRLSSLAAGTFLSRTYERLNGGDISAIDDLVNPAGSLAYSYDLAERLTSSDGPFGNAGYGYDGVGNRLSKDIDGQGTGYTYLPGTNILAASTGAQAATYVHDPAGFMTVNGTKGFTYDASGRMASASVAGTQVGVYAYNGQGQRTVKTADGQTTVFLYDLSGNMVGEYYSDGTMIAETVYADGMRIARFAGTAEPGPVGVTFTLTGSGQPLSGVGCYLFTEAGAYTGKSTVTIEDGTASFGVEEGSYKIRADYLGYQFWSNIFDAVGHTASLEIPHQAVTVTVQTVHQGTDTPVFDAPVYLFTGAGSYQSITANTDASGQATFSVPQEAYKIRADYLTKQYWSSDLTWADGTISVPLGTLTASFVFDGAPVEGVNAYLFNSSGTYLSITGVTAADGTIAFIVPEGDYQVRFDFMNGQYWSTVSAVSPDGTTVAAVDPGGATVTVTVEDGLGGTIEGVPLYVYRDTGAYLNLTTGTDASGQASFTLPAGSFKVRGDRLGYQYWTADFDPEASSSLSFVIDHYAVTITVQENVQGGSTPLTGVPTYVYRSDGTYQSLNLTTDGSGEVTYLLPGTPPDAGLEGYYVRADYLGYQWFSANFDPKAQTAVTVPLPSADVVASVVGDMAGDEQPLESVPTFLFTPEDVYMGLTQDTDTAGETTYRVPVTPYKLRADYMSGQFWSEDFAGNAFTLTVPEGIAEVTVTGGGSPVEGVPVYAFKDSGAYLNLTDTTDASGITSFRLPEQSYQFRADRMGSQYWSNVLALTPGITNPVSIDVGGGDLVYTLTRDSGATPMQGVNSYLFTEAGAYMGMYGATDASGEVPYDVSEGSYKVRSDYLGYQFWSGVVDTSASLTLTQDIPHTGVDVGVLSSYQGTYTPITGVKTYLFKSSGAYMGKTLTTDISGLVTYDLPEREYKVRGDYLGYQWWSDSFIWTASDVVIPEGEVTITVTDSGVPAQANVYVFTSGGSYMGLYAATDANGEVSFLLPADGGNSTNYNGYKFRADYSGTQTWSDPLLVTADVINPVSIEVGGSASSKSLHNPSSPLRGEDRGGGDEVQVASLFLLPGILAGLTNSAFADSNGEHLYFYHSDHLGTPLFLTDTDGVVVWRGEYLPFGEVFSEDKDPDGDGVEVEQPFRFPGQYHDQETGLYYNYFRDYDPGLGRYVEIVGKPSENEPNLYVYTNANPINLIDPLGLAPIPGTEDDVEYIFDWPSAGMGAGDFLQNYFNLKASRIGIADKYFHCLANCRATRRGRGGADIAISISEAKEFLDVLGGASQETCDEDRAANETGRSGDPSLSCQDVCAQYRPDHLKGNY